MIIAYWRPDLNAGIWIALFWAVFTATNLLPVRWFPELEMWFSSIKVLTIAAFVVFAVAVAAGASQQGTIGFAYWHDPGPFGHYILPGVPGQVLGVCGVLIQATFSFQGTELVGSGAGEARNPRKTVPRAVSATFWSVTSMFVLTIFSIGLVVPSNSSQLLRGDREADSSTREDASASPLVIAAVRAGIPLLAHAINAVLLTAVLSAANSNIYSASRGLVSLAQEGLAPRWLARTSTSGVPRQAVAITSIFGLLALLNLSPVGGNIFNWLVSVIAVAGLVTWGCICLAHLRFMAALKAQGVVREDLPYKAPCQPWLSGYGVGFIAIIILTQGFAAFIPWDTTEFFVAYLRLIIFVVCFVGHKVSMRTRVIPLRHVNLRPRQDL